MISDIDVYVPIADEMIPITMISTHNDPYQRRETQYLINKQTARHLLIIAMNVNYMLIHT